MCICVCVYMCVCIYVWDLIDISGSREKGFRGWCVGLYVYIYMYVYICVFIYVCDLIDTHQIDTHQRQLSEKVGV